MKLKITDLQSHDDDANLAYTVTFDDFDRGRCMAVRLTESAFFEPAAHPDCEGFDVELEAEGKLHTRKYDTETVVRTIQKYIEDEASRENSD
jgi:hypothetical protein